MLHELAHGSDAGGPRQLSELSELGLAVDPSREDADEEAALRLRPGCGIGLTRGHSRIMPRYSLD
jgi:hypothetical protein